jgi:hypothetical protein
MADETKPDVDVNRGPFASAEQARAAKPDNPHYQLLRVTGPEGPSVFFWARGHADALAAQARVLGYRASLAGKPPDKAKLAAQLAELSPEDRAALLAQLGGAPAAPAPATPPTPAPEQPAKGKKGGNK